MLFDEFDRFFEKRFRIRPAASAGAASVYCVRACTIPEGPTAAARASITRART